MTTRSFTELVSDPEKRVLEAYIYYHRSSPNKVPSYRQIGEKAGIPVRAVPDHIRKLEERGLITYQHLHTTTEHYKLQSSIQERIKKRRARRKSPMTVKA